MALSKMLGDAGFTVNHIETHASVTLEKVDDGFEITVSHLDVVASVPGVDLSKFEEIANKAKAECPVSQLLKS